MLSEIPLDILINILSFLPPSRSQKDSSGGTLAACLRVNSLFAEAARMPSLWKAHYEVRFEHCDETAESSRFSQSGDDWKQLYIERRRIDRQVQQCLASLVVNSPGRLRLCKEVVTYGMDVWDVLDLERTSSLSAQLFETDEDRNPGPVSIKTTARRYWAGYILDRISRRTAVLLWRRFWTPDVQQPSFEETMTHLSCFYGCSPKRITARLEDLATRCREVIRSKGLQLATPEITATDVVMLCKEIVDFMRSDGYRLPGGRDYYALENKFPHYYLYTHKQTIPMSLVHIFVAIATRLGLDAAPINFPGTVLAHVRHPKLAGTRPIVIHPGAEGTLGVVADLNTVNPDQTGIHVLQNAIPTITDEETFSPSGGMPMLFRSVNNVRASIMASQSITPQLEYPTWLLVVQVYMLFQLNDAHIRNLLSSVRLDSLDAVLMLEDLRPVLPPRVQQILNVHCSGILDEESHSARWVAPKRSERDVKYFVGLPVLHSSGQRGIIRSWRVKQDLENEGSSLDVNSTDLGTLSYDVLSFSGKVFTATEKELLPVTISRDEADNFLMASPTAPRYFSHFHWSQDANVNGEAGRKRARIVGTPELQNWYPEDEDVGQHWISTGRLKLAQS